MSAAADPDFFSLAGSALAAVRGGVTVAPELTRLGRVPWEIAWQWDPGATTTTAAAGELLAFEDAAGVVAVRFSLRRAGRDGAEHRWDDARQNYLAAWAEPDGTATVLEAEVAFTREAPWKPAGTAVVRLGVPLALVGPGVHRVALRLDPARLALSVDGRLVDEDWPHGRPAHVPDRLRLGGTAAVAGVTVRAATDVDSPVTAGTTTTIPGSAIQYWSPPGHNQWLGDVSLTAAEGALHLFYLVDRRHGASKLGTGGHQIAQLSTRDLAVWHDHGLAVAIDEPWETFGTGSMVFHDGRFHLFYGMHTDRVVDRAHVLTATDAGGATPEGGFVPRPFDPERPPMGTAVAVSEDGVHFVKQRELLHDAQNPSVFHDTTTGEFILIAGYGADGTFASRDLRHWRRLEGVRLPTGVEARHANTTECLCHLAWNGWHHFIGGRSGWWQARDLRGPYAACGDPDGPRWDVYDGLWVPMMARVADGRVVLAGWLQDGANGWAGNLVLRELRQEPDGTLALRWPEETMPPLGQTPDFRLRAGPEANVSLTDDGAMATLRAPTNGLAYVCLDELPEEFLLETWVEPGAQAFGVCVLGSGEYEDGCELRLEPTQQRAQWGRASGGRLAPAVPTIEEILAAPGGRAPIHKHPSPHLHYRGGDFALSNVPGLDAPFLLRLLVVRDRKAGSVIVDAEIAGRRTLITRRRGYPGRRVFLFSADGGTTRFTVRSLRPLVR